MNAAAGAIARQHQDLKSMAAFTSPSTREEVDTTTAVGACGANSARLQWVQGKASDGCVHMLFIA